MSDVTRRAAARAGLVRRVTPQTLRHRGRARPLFLRSQERGPLGGPWGPGLCFLDAQDAIIDFLKSFAVRQLSEPPVSVVRTGAAYAGCGKRGCQPSPAAAEHRFAVATTGKRRRILTQARNAATARSWCARSVAFSPKSSSQCLIRLEMCPSLRNRSDAAIERSVTRPSCHPSHATRFRRGWPRVERMDSAVSPAAFATALTIVCILGLPAARCVQG